MFEARSITARIRLTRELLAVINEWAAAHNVARSTAIQRLVLRGLAWEEAKHASTSAQQPQQLAA
jgi:hypothetical protein